MMVLKSQYPTEDISIEGSRRVGPHRLWKLNTRYEGELVSFRQLKKHSQSRIAFESFSSFRERQG